MTREQAIKKAEELYVEPTLKEMMSNFDTESIYYSAYMKGFVACYDLLSQEQKTISEENIRKEAVKFINARLFPDIDPDDETESGMQWKDIVLFMTDFAFEQSQLNNKDK